MANSDASIPVNWRLQFSPPSSVCRTTPLWPTAQPWVSVPKSTAVRVTDTGTLPCSQDFPPSSEYMMCPLSPTATILSPARTASLRRLDGAKSVCRAGVSIRSASAYAAGADQTMESPRQAAPSVLHINLLAIQIAYYVVLTVNLWRAL